MAHATVAISDEAIMRNRLQFDERHAAPSLTVKNLNYSYFGRYALAGADELAQ